MPSSQSNKSNSFAICNNAKAATRRGVKVACMNSDYVNSVYNALVDVSDCFNIPQKDLLAKLSNESGLHINAFGAHGDSGIGQLTGDAIQSVLQPYWQEGGNITVRDYYIAEINKSNKASCQRIRDYPTSTEIIKVNVNNRCNLMSPPENPYRNLLYTALFYRTLLHEIAGVRFVDGKDFIERVNGLQMVTPDKNFDPGGLIARYEIKKNLQALGIANPDMHAVTRAMVMLGYNAGPGKAAEYFNVYLKKRLQAKKPLKDSDVDFLNTDFMSTWQTLTRGAKPDRKAGHKLLEARRSAHIKPMPEYLMLIQDSGTPGYLSRIALKHKELIQMMGDQRCVSPNFVHF